MADQIKREIAAEAVSGKAPKAQKRSLATEEKKGFDISALILVAVLLAAGAVLKMTVGSFVNFFGMKPNFIIAMYCLAILLVRPNLGQAAIIGLIAGAVCQLLPGTPYINFISEFLGAVAMAALIRIPMKIGKANFSTIVSTFLATVVSGSAFTICLFLFIGADASSLVAYVPIVLFTALINCVIVQILYVPLAKILKKEAPQTALA
ncbi:tryptophan transporter [Raoultibacter phocaeensis]|uniref:tryptophan transporter n=1 Tax=Raoultibacter phocaeensis TaxID=2479841 RepID=UPI001118662B|nr:tryptophan transporter [Raoultibacter phocaeensis]